MASAWGKSWGLAFGAAFGAVGGAIAPAPAQPLGGSIIRRRGGQRRVLPYIEPLPEFSDSFATKNVAIQEALASTKRTRAERDIEHLLLLH